MATEGIIAGAGSAIGGAFTGIWKVVISIFSLLFLKWRITFTLIFLSMFLGNAFYASMQQKSFEPLVMKAGGLFASADEQLYWRVRQIEANDWRLPANSIDPEEEEGNFWRDLKSSLSKAYFFIEIIGAGWFVYIMGYFFFVLFKLHNDSEKAWCMIFAVMVLIFLQCSYGLAMLYLNYEPSVIPLTKQQKLKNISFALIPLKGGGLTMYHMFFTGNLWKNTILKSAVPSPEKFAINKTNSSITLNF